MPCTITLRRSRGFCHPLAVAKSIMRLFVTGARRRYEQVKN